MWIRFLPRLSVLCVFVSVTIPLSAPLLASGSADADAPVPAVDYKDTHGFFLREEAYTLGRALGLTRTRACPISVRFPVLSEDTVSMDKFRKHADPCPGGSGLDCNADTYCDPQSYARFSDYCVPPKLCEEMFCDVSTSESTCCACMVLNGLCAGCERDKTCTQ